MPLDPEEPAPRGGRIILPGGDEPEREQPSKIILPPGVARTETEDVPEYPRLRSLVLVPFSDGQRELLLVNDPLGVVEGQPVLGMESLAILQLLDGNTSVNDITTALMRDSKDLRIANMLRDFIAQLDRLLLLESPRFDAAYKARRDEYHMLEIRAAVLDGRAYPAERAECEKFLDESFAAATKLRDEAGNPVAAATATPRALMAPHLDPRRSGPTLARAFLELGDQPAGPLRFVIFGTGHSLLEDKFALTRKHFQTPLGKAMCDVAFVDRIASHLGDLAYHGELAHRDEHSIEFQVLYLQRRLGTRPFTIVPILCGGFHTLLDEGRTPRDEPAFEALINGVREAEKAAGGTTIYIAGVDFSHVGPRFGDPPLDDEIRKAIEAQDRGGIAAAERGDADAWYAAIAATGDATRICGFAPTYAMLRCAEPGAGRLLRYEPSDEPDGTVVTIAAMVWP